MKPEKSRAPENLEVIRIRDLSLKCIIGINEEERNIEQEVMINIAIRADLGLACSSDRIEDTIDYKALKRQVIQMVRASSFFLIERLAEEIAKICLAPPLARFVTVTLDKPYALTHARSVSVEITRSKDYDE